jgi:hypothetical protein
MSDRYTFFKKNLFLRKTTIVRSIAIILSLYIYFYLCLQFLFHYDFDHIKCFCFKSYCYTCTHIFSQLYLLNLVKTFSFDNGWYCIIQGNNRAVLFGWHLGVRKQEHYWKNSFAILLKKKLGVRTSTPNIMVYGEIGRYPIALQIKIKMLCFWNKIVGNPDKLSCKIYRLLFINYL